MASLTRGDLAGDAGGGAEGGHVPGLALAAALDAPSRQHSLGIRVATQTMYRHNKIIKLINNENFIDFCF